MRRLEKKMILLKSNQKEQECNGANLENDFDIFYDFVILQRE